MKKTKQQNKQVTKIKRYIKSKYKLLGRDGIYENK